MKPPASRAFGLLLLLICSTHPVPSGAQTMDLCGDPGPHPPPNRSRLVKHQTQPVIGKGNTQTTSWIVETKTGGGNISVRMVWDGGATDLRGIPCSDTPPYFDRSSMVIILLSDGSKIRYCPGRPDPRSYVSGSRIEIAHCRPTRASQFMLEVTGSITGTRRATKAITTVAMKRTAVPQWLALETPDKGLVAVLSNIIVRRGRSGGCKTGYIRILDALGENVLPELPIICNKSGITIPSSQRVVTPRPLVNITFKGAYFKLTFYSSPLSEISKFLLTTATATTISLRKVANNNSTTIPSVQNNDSAAGGDENIGKVPQDGASRIYEAIGLGCAGVFVILAFVVGCVMLQKRRKRSAHHRNMSTKQARSTDVTEYMDRRELGGEDGVRSINNLMYDNVRQNGDPRKESLASQTSRGPLLAPNDRPQYGSEAEKRQQRLSQLQDVYLDYDGRPTAKRASPKPLPIPPPDQGGERPQLPTPAPPATPHFYATIKDETGGEERITAAYACVNKNRSAENSVQSEDEDKEEFNTIPDVAEYTSSNRLPLRRETGMVPPARLTIDKHPPVAEYGSTQRQQTSTPSFSLTPSDPHLDRRDLEVSSSNPGLPLVDNEGYLSLNSVDDLPPAPEPRPSEHQSYVEANSVSQEDVRKHFLRKKKVPGRPYLADNSAATSMPELVHKNNQANGKEPRGLPARNRLRPPQMSFSGQSLAAQKRYKQPRPSAPDIFIQCAYTSGEDVTRIREHLEQVAAKARLEKQGSAPGEEEEDSRLLEVGSTESGFFYDSPRPSIGSSQDSLLSARGPPSNFYDAPRPSLPNIFPDDVRRLVASSESLREGGEI